MTTAETETDPKTESKTPSDLDPISDARCAWASLNAIPGLGPRRAGALARALPRIDDLLTTPIPELARRLRLPTELIARFRDPPQLAAARAKLRADTHTTRRLDPWDGLPHALLNIPDPPPWLFTLGHGSLSDDAPKVAIVGSRDASIDGLTNARALAAELASHGLTIVSGLARGIDGAAIRGALHAGGRAIAVLGHGLQTISPKRHTKLARELCTRGALASELPWGQPPHPAHFPRRNRIIAGLSLATIVVEAAPRSGALITARCALEQGREVLAVPGSLRLTQTAGTHALIRDGAGIVTCAQDVLDALAVLPPTTSSLPPPDPLQHTLLHALRSATTPRPSDDRPAMLSQPPSSIARAISLLELRGQATRHGAHISATPRHSPTAKG